MESAKTDMDPSHFAWIEESNNRQCIWSHELLHRKGAPIIPMSTMATTERRKAIVHVIDIFEEEEDKAIFVQELQREWHSVSRDRRVEKWLPAGKPAEKQCFWTRDYLERNWKMLPLTETTREGVRAAVLASFDIWTDNKAAKQLFIEKMKRTWSQQKYREGLGGRKQYNTVMSNQIKSKLNALARYHGKKINETLEELIEKEYSRINGHDVLDEMQSEELKEIECREAERTANKEHHGGV